MAGYIIAHITVTDPATFEKYREKVPAVIEQYGGRYLIRGGAVETLEGSVPDRRLVIIEFPSVEQAKTWHSSPEYQPLITLRQSASDGDVIVVEGV